MFHMKSEYFSLKLECDLKSILEGNILNLFNKIQKQVFEYSPLSS